MSILLRNCLLLCYGACFGSEYTSPTDIGALKHTLFIVL